MQDVPYGYCHCGCGQRTKLARQNETARGYIKGEPLRFIQGHNYSGPPANKKPIRYLAEDRGYRTPCWIWQACVASHGYGLTWDRTRNKENYAHRVYYELLVGPIPEGKQLDHLCRNRACVNPDHLEPVTLAENCRRGAKTQVTWSVAFAIRLMHGSTTLSQRQIADTLGTTRPVVYHVLHGKTWQVVAGG